MTAKEIAEKREVSRYFLPKDGKHKWEKVYEFTPEQLQEYADALCKEQRSACLEAYEDDWESESILTAPQPEAFRFPQSKRERVKDAIRRWQESSKVPMYDDLANQIDKIYKEVEKS